MKKLLALVLSLITFSLPCFPQEVGELEVNKKPGRLIFEGAIEKPTITSSEVEELIFDDDEVSKKFAKKIKGYTPKVKEELERIFNYKLCPVSLEQCLKIALYKNYQVRILSKEKESTKWGWKNTQTEFLPDIYYNFVIQRLSGEFLVDNVIPITINETPINSTFTFDWYLFRGFLRYFNAKSAKNLYKGAKEQVAFTIDETLLNTTLQYYELLASKMRIEVLERNLKENEAQVDITSEQFKWGFGTRFDVTRAEARVALSQEALIAAYNNFRLLQAQLANTMGISVMSPLYPQSETLEEELIVSEKYSLPELQSIAELVRPDLKKINYDIKALKAQRKAIYSGYMPDVLFRAQTAFAGTADVGLNPNHSASLFIRWPFGRGLGLNEYTRLQDFKARIEKRELELTDRKRQIKQDLVDSFYDTLAAKKRIEAAKMRVESADESLRLSFLRLYAGLGIYVDVLQAQAAKTDARLNYINAVIDYNTAQVRTLFNSGVISVHNVTEGFE